MTQQPMIEKTTVPRHGETTVRRSRGRRAQILALLAAAFGFAAQGALAYEVGSPIPGEPLLLSSEPDYQVLARVSGNWVVYTAQNSGLSDVRYQDLVTGADEAIPNVGIRTDWDGVIDGTTIVYTHLSPQTGFGIYSFDLAAGAPPVELDPQAFTEREAAAIGGGTVAWTDWGPRGGAPAFYSDIVAYDRATGEVTLLTDDAYNSDPQVSSDGRAIVWMRCQGYRTGCDVWQATRVEGVWAASALAADPAVEETVPDTDGDLVVYVRDGSDLAWQPLGGGTEQTLGMAGGIGTPSISGHFIAFTSRPPAGTRWDLWVYDLNRDRVRQATFGPESARVPDLFVSAAGLARLVWTTGDYLDWRVHALIFEVPADLPVDEIGDLRDLVASFGLPRGMETSLTAKLTAAIGAIEAGDFAAACAKLADFMSEVRAQSGKALAPDQAAALLAAAGEIRQALGC